MNHTQFRRLLKLNVLQESIRFYENLIDENNLLFLELFKLSLTDEILNVSFSSDSVKIVYCDVDGMHIANSIKMSEFNKFVLDCK